MTDPETTYLAEAAEQLRLARAANEERLRVAAAAHSGQREEASRILREANARRMELAEAFTRLAAIEAGLPPCCHVLRPEPARDPEEQP